VAETLGKPELSMSVKSLELPAYDPRGAYGWRWRTPPATGADAICGRIPSPTRSSASPSPRTGSRSGKARMIKIAEDANAAVDSLVACKFAFFGASLEEYAELLSG